MSLLTKKTIRTKLDVSLDIVTPLDLKTWRGNATDFEIGVFDGVDVVSLSDVTSVNLKVQPSQTDDTTLMDSTVASTEIDDTLTASTWDDGTKQHATFSFTNAQTNLDIDRDKSTYWIVFTALLTGGEEVTLGAGSFEVHEDNNESSGDPDVNPGTPITLEEADARYLDFPTYDPQTIDGDAFDMGNMTEDTDAKVMTAQERTDIAATKARDWVEVTANSKPNSDPPSSYADGNLYIMAVTSSIGYPSSGGKVFTDTRIHSDTFYSFQTFYDSSAPEGGVYERFEVVPSTWSDWKKIAAEDDVVAYTDQSGLAKSDAEKLQARTNIGLEKTYKTPSSKIAFLGDSITSDCWGLVAANLEFWGRWIAAADHRLGAAIERVPSSNGFHFATGGFTLRQMIDTWLPEVLTSGADMCVVLGGTNGALETGQEKFDDWLEIIAALESNGTRPVAMTTMPRSTPTDPAHVTALLEFNDLIRGYCKANAILLCDMYSALVDHATGEFIADFTTDGTHPNSTGSHRMGAILANTLKNYTSAGNIFPDFDSDKWLTPNSFMTGDSSGVATGWTISNVGAASNTPSKVARTDNNPGDWQQIVIGGGGTTSDGIAMSDSAEGYAEGDVLKGVVEIEFDSSGFGIYAIGTKLQTADAGGAQQAYSPYLGGTSELADLTAFIDVPVAVSGRAIVYETPEITIGATPSQALFVFYARGVGTLRISRCGIVKTN